MRFTGREAPLQVAIAALLLWTPARGAEPSLSGAPPAGVASAVASFDCSRAAAGREQLICSDPALSALDGQLGSLYRERRARLSPQGARLLQESERNWLRFVSTVCVPNDPEAQKLGRTRKNCLKGEYTDRIKRVESIGQKIGPYIFNGVDFYAAEPADNGTGGSTGFYVQHVAYPQIDNANSPELVAWNRQNVKPPSTEAECDTNGDSSLDYEIGSATARFISVEWALSTYCHGTPHGFFQVEVRNTVLSPHPRALSAQDVFGPSQGWVRPLQERFWAALMKSGWRPPDNQPEDIKSQLEEDFIQPNRWLFTPDGLRVSFSAYEGGCYACTPQPVTVPWSDLKPLLSKTAIVP